MDDELRRMKYRQKKRQRLTCTLTHEEMILLEAEEKRLRRALNDLEMFVLFGKINSKGQRVMPTGGLWKGVGSDKNRKEKNTD